MPLPRRYDRTLTKPLEQLFLSNRVLKSTSSRFPLAFVEASDHERIEDLKASDHDQIEDLKDLIQDTMQTQIDKIVDMDIHG